MRYIIYIDRLFALQAAQTLALLLLTGMFLRGYGATAPGPLWRMILYSGVEALFFCGVFLLPGMDGRIKNLLFAAGTLLLLAAVFRIRTPGLFFRAAILFHGAAFLLGGMMYAWSGMVGSRLMAHTFPAAVCAMVSAAVIVLVWNWEKERREKLLATVEILEGNVRVVTLALIDSGNSLYDPLSARPVSVVERSVLEGRIPLNRPEKFRLVPYHTLGGRGVMQAIEVAEMRVKREGQDILIEKALLGLYDGEITREGTYRMILHPAMLKTGGMRHDIKSSNTRKNTV